MVVISTELYAMMLDARTTAWIEHRDCRAQGQADFRKDLRTTEQLFTAAQLKCMQVSSIIMLPEVHVR